MSYIDELKTKLTKVFTENGDVAFSTTGSYCLDLFAQIGGKRYKNDDELSLFAKAFYEDKLLAIKIMFYARDIRNGLGERSLFRTNLNYLANFYTDIARKLIEYVPVYGRYDDLLSLLFTPAEEDMILFIKKQLEIDIQNKKENKPISLLSKWLPSINASSSETITIAKYLCAKLGYSKTEYRKTLSFLRKGSILENNLRLKDYTFAYDKLPSNAMFKYIRAFLRNDTERYTTFLSQVEKKEKSINTSAIYPYIVIDQILYRYNYASDTYEVTEEVKKILDLTWNEINRSQFSSKTIVVLDTSGSMFTGGPASPISIGISIALLLSEQLTEPFKNTFISFSETPQLIQVPKGDIYDKVNFILGFCEVANTNISLVYDLILRIAMENKLPKEEMITRIVIISDMEFDEGISGVSTFESFKQKYTMCGYDMPQLVFWNADNRNNHLPIRMNENNVKLVSGASDKIIDMVMNNEDTNPYEFMLKSLERYNVFDKLDIK